MMYMIIILCTMIVDIGLAIGVGYAIVGISLYEAIGGPIFTLAYVLVLLGVLDLLLHILPKSLYDYKKKFYISTKKEIQFYEKINIRKWKGKVPEMGASGGFSKRNLKSLEPEYIQRFIYETCLGEILHLLTGVLTCLAFFPLSQYYFVLPILIVNLILHLLPCFIQRYNRYKLVIVYDYITRHSA